ncbi:hypothetical protein Tco_0732657 [Tanacetum coccineum]
MQQMWNTLQLADSKEVFKFKVDKEEVTFLLDDHCTMLKLPQATANNHVELVEAPELGTMIKFLNILFHALMNPSTKNPVIPYPCFTKLITDYILTTHHDITKRSNESHHLVAHDDVVQCIFASGKSKGRGIGIPNYLLTTEIMQTNAYKVYVAEFNLDVPMTQS